MNGQFVDLFDGKRHGLNYWAAAAVCFGILLGFIPDGLTALYDSLVNGTTSVATGGGPGSLTGLILLLLRGHAMSAVGFGLILFAAATLVRTDLLFPLAAGVLWLVWNFLLQWVGWVNGGGAITRDFLFSFGEGFLLFGTLALSYRIFANKLLALAGGMSVGILFSILLNTFRFEIPLESVAEFAPRMVLIQFVAGVFLFSGLAHHFALRGIRFGEFGFLPNGEGPEGQPSGDPVFAETPGPLKTLLLLVVTANLYVLVWVYRVYGEVRRRARDATRITPGKAMGFFFIPIFDFFWALWLWTDIPRAIEKMEAADPPSGLHSNRWVITGSLVLATLLGIGGAYLWTPGLYLSALFLWAGILLAQSELNSHWEAHRRAV